jgi:antitoxin component YwqK of YwqJK toxin-antitoxin module
VLPVIAVILLLASCKPRTRTTEQEKYLNQAMVFIRMDDSTKRIAYNTMTNEKRNAIDSILKSYQNATETVVTTESYVGFNVSVTVETAIEKGKVLHQKAKYENGTMAFEYYPVRNGEIVDSTLHYYPAGQLYSRTIVYTDPSKWMFENYHENGALRSRQYRNITNGWDENGNLVSEILFENDEVVKQTLFHSNGIKKWESHWKNDKFHGAVKEWDSLGTLVRSERYSHGDLIQKK